ncbi:acyltransferase [Rhizobium sp. L43]|uniref:acyltransferase family protein n=1 Tax=Rhizobium sp. L43 TaxID=2035452 RepID=UPI000BE7C12F|nr:acyltransferase [Rhizobium sp. L43]PDS76372.1 hypothetical protein CO667_22510 [Rhizobium sp. L43]
MAGLENRNTLVGLQYVRAIAVIFVVIDHINIVIGLEKYIGRRIINVDNLFLGAIGVNVFFVLSGFIMVFISLDAKSLAPKVSVKLFFLRRIERIVPFLWFCVAAYAALRFFARDGEADWWAYIRAAFFFPYGTINPTQAWTLRYEMLFYTIFAFWIAFPLVGRYFVVLWVASPMILSVLSLSAPADFLFTPINILFGLGAAIGIIYKLRPWVFRNSNLSVAIIALAFCGANFLYSIISYSHYLISTVVYSCSLSALIIVIAVGVCPIGVPSLKFRFLAFLGDASYSIYLTHGIFLSALAGISSHYLRQFPLPAIYTLILAAALAGGALIHVYIERPIIAVLRNVSKRSWKLDAVGTNPH